jgi:spermidine synthase
MGALSDRSDLGLTRPELAVFVSGVASMGLEILAGRMVAPEFGSSIYTWGSIIGVFLAALSLGYHYGGKNAARRASLDRVAWLLLGTAGYVAVITLVGDVLLMATATVPLPTRFASLPAITLLFGPPTFFLGFISPYAAELSATEEIGRASGRVYAVGTVGSILGAFGTTFLLVPALGIQAISFLFGVLLVATTVGIRLPRIDRRQVLVSLGVTVVLVAAIGGGAVGISTRGAVVYQTQTPYQQLQVTDVGETRTLYLDGQPHSAMDRGDPDRHVFAYTRYFHLPYLFVDDPDDIDRVLFIGGGGFTGPKRFATEYNATIDVAEIDPAVVDAARRYFRLEESPTLDVHVVGGRQFLQETNRTYDLIVLDAYKKDKVPFQLTTVEFMELTRDRLSADGVLIANLISAPSGPASSFYRAEFRTMEQVYPQVYAFPTVGGAAVQNIEVVATKADRRLTEHALRERNRQRDVGIDLSEELRTYHPDPPVEDVPILRDDRAPVDTLLDPMIGQRYVVEQTADSNQTRDRAPKIADAPWRETV